MSRTVRYDGLGNDRNSMVLSPPWSNALKVQKRQVCRDLQPAAKTNRLKCMTTLAGWSDEHAEIS